MTHLDVRQLVPERQGVTRVATVVRQRWLIGFFVLAWLVILGRAVQLELAFGKDFRAEALKPLRREITLEGKRGRILAIDGTVLAADEDLLALAVHYRYLQKSLDAAWLRSQARLRLPRADRRNRDGVNAEMVDLARDIRAMNVRLAQLCGLSEQAWQARAERIEARIEKMAARVNERRWEKFSAATSSVPPEQTAEPAEWWNVVANLPDALRALGTPEEAKWEPVIVREQVDYHILVENLSSAAAEEIRGDTETYPGVRVLEVPRRIYPHGTLAANVIGHLHRIPASEQVDGEGESIEPTGAMGLELRFNADLTGLDGSAIERTDRRGRLLATEETTPAASGADIQLTIDPQAQHLSEALLDRVLERSRLARGGAIVLLDVRDGGVLALASAPRFNPAAFTLGDSEAISRSLSDPDRPMFDRATRMALPPGGLMQPFIAMAMLESNRVPSQVAYECLGQLDEQSGIECAIFREQAEGHGGVTLTGALECNCRVYFAHYANALGGTRLLLAASRLGFGRATGIELPSEAEGNLPLPENASGGRPVFAKGATQLLAVGQGSVAVTPLQMARAMAVIANGGKLVTPRLLVGTDAAAEPVGYKAETIKRIGQSLTRAVETSESAQELLGAQDVQVVGLVDSADVTGDKPDHAWCAGYFPADKPRYAFAIAIEHGGDASRIASPIARRLIEQLSVSSGAEN